MSSERTSHPNPGESPTRKQVADNEQDSKATRDTILNAYCWTIIAATVYVFSFGPAYWFWYDSAHLGGSPLLKWFYWPLVAVCEQVEMINNVLNWYVGLWAM